MLRAAMACGGVILGWMAVAAGILVMTTLAASAEGGSRSIEAAAGPMLGAGTASSAAARLSCQAAVKIVSIAPQSGAYPELQARHQAIAGWRAQVAQQYGQDYTHWWRARDKDVSCQGQGPALRCEAMATPCIVQGGPGGALQQVAPLSGLGMVERAR